ncbi:hypothetical protein QT17_12970, partial [Thermus sp. 2.9]
MNLACADTGGIPLLYAPGDGNQSDREALVSLVARYRGFLDLGEVVVLDGASASPFEGGGGGGGVASLASGLPEVGYGGCTAAVALGGERGAGQEAP